MYDAARAQIDTLISPTSPIAVTFTSDTITLTYNYSDYAFLDTIELTLFEAQRFGFSDWIKADSLYKGIPFKVVYDWLKLANVMDFGEKIGLNVYLKRV